MFCANFYFEEYQAKPKVTHFQGQRYTHTNRQKPELIESKKKVLCGLSKPGSLKLDAH